MKHLPLFSRQIVQYISFLGDQSYSGLTPPLLRNVQWESPIAFTVRKLRWLIKDNTGTGKSWVITLIKNSVATSLTSTIDGNSDEGTDFVNEVSVVAGDRLIWQIEGETGEPAPDTISSISFEREAEANQ